MSKNIIYKRFLIYIMSFTLHNNNSNLTTKFSLNKNLFKEQLNNLDRKWDKWNKKYQKMLIDIENLERMFNDYKSNPIFINVKEVLQNEQEENKKVINHLEEQLYVLKRNFSIS